MSIYNQIYSIMVPASQANFTAHTYVQIYASAAASPTINGVVVSLAAGTQLSLMVRDITPTPNVFLLGDAGNLSSEAVILG